MKIRDLTRIFKDKRIIFSEPIQELCKLELKNSFETLTIVADIEHCCCVNPPDTISKIDVPAQVAFLLYANTGRPRRLVLHAYEKFIRHEPVTHSSSNRKEMS
jgi:hypothetical protein